MTLTVSFEPDRRRVVLVGTGRLVFAEFEAIREALRADPRFDPTGDQLVDLSGADVGGLSADNVRAIAGTSPFRPGARRAIVSPAPLAYGLARMYQMLADEQKGTVAVFSNREDAERWLDGLDE